MIHELREIHHIVEKINQDHLHHLQDIREPVLIKINLSDNSHSYVEISRNGLRFVESHKEHHIKNQVILSFKDLKKLIDNPSNILRFVLNGRVKIKGNIKEILKVLEKI
ncbi:MAG: SCP2 sterol-binding domain-containing protein [Sulfurihydrogenibium azorense]|uniref:SCP2 sterol-binding domain-containing protein n=1 Tax=Sulfurihydrogenibium azorense TaxID=309806 RepID=UPI00391D711F